MTRKREIIDTLAMIGREGYVNSLKEYELIDFSKVIDIMVSTVLDLAKEVGDNPKSMMWFYFSETFPAIYEGYINSNYFWDNHNNDLE